MGTLLQALLGSSGELQQSSHKGQTQNVLEHVYMTYTTHPIRLPCALQGTTRGGS